MKDHEADSRFCPVYTAAVELIGRRWTGAVVRMLLGGPARFGAISSAVPGLTDRMLSARLRELEEEGIVSRTVTPGRPVCIEYALTRKGADLARVVEVVADWGHAWLEAPNASST